MKIFFLCDGHGRFYAWTVFRFDTWFGDSRVAFIAQLILEFRMIIIYRVMCDVSGWGNGQI